jgi:hypothetical protein
MEIEAPAAAAAGAKAPKKIKAPAKDDMGGLPLNSLILAKWRDGSWRAAVLLDKRESRPPQFATKITSKVVKYA